MLSSPPSLGDTMVGEEGLVKVDGSTTWCWHWGKTSPMPEDRVTRLKYQNGDNYLFVGRFDNLRVFLNPDEAREAVIGKGTSTLGITGYSILKPETELEWGCPVGSYMKALRTYLKTMVTTYIDALGKGSLRIVDGASDLGGDAIIIGIAEEDDVPRLGFSCGKFLPYVKDNNSSVFVAATQKLYSFEFVKSLNTLVVACGRDQALSFDSITGIKRHKKVILANIIRAVSTLKSVPALADDQETVVNATQAIQDALGEEPDATLDALMLRTIPDFVGYSRKLLPVDVAYPTTPRILKLAH